MGFFEQQRHSCLASLVDDKHHNSALEVQSIPSQKDEYCSDMHFQKARV